MFAIVEAYRTGLLKPKNWLPNIIAGLIVGVVALPLAMAFAIASGVNPEQGLYTAIIAALVVGLFGGSPVQIAGPTGAFVVILAGITARYGVDGLQIATLIAGIMLVLMGWAKLGTVIKFIPDPVIVGFTAGIGVIIFVGEWKDFFGLTVKTSLDAHFHTKIIALINQLPHLNWATTGLGLLSLFLVIITPKIVRRIPGPLVAMLAATALQSLYQFEGIATIGSAFGGITQSLPSFHIPSITLSQAFSLVGPAFTIALLGAIESLLSATVADGMAGTRHHSNHELIGQGFANILVPLFGGFAATGAIARTATNVRNGGNSPISAITHSVLLVLIILFLAPYAASIPLCALAAILFVVAYNMSDIPHFIYMIKHAPSYDIIVLILTFLLTIFTNLMIAVNVGVILAMLFFVRNMSAVVSVEQNDHETLKDELATNGISALPKNTVVYTLQGPFFFAAAEKLEHTFAVTHADPVNLIFRLKYVPFMDMTGLQTFMEIITEFHKRGVKVYLCESNPEINQKLTQIGAVAMLVDQRVFTTFGEVVLNLKDKQG